LFQGFRLWTNKEEIIMKYDIIEGTTLQDAFDKGYKKYKTLPLGMKEVWTLRERNKIPFQWYDTRTVFFRGNIRLGTLEEFKNLKDFYKREGRVLFAGLYYDFSLNGDHNLNYKGRFVWKVKKNDIL